VITLDTSAVFALVNCSDRDHRRVSHAIAIERGPLFLPAATRGEIAYLVEQRLDPRVLIDFLRDIDEGGLTLDCGEHDMGRIGELVARYHDLPLGLVDAAVIACAERHGGRRLTLDLRHFGVVAREGLLTIFPE